jgi:hypothetical protein
MTDDEKQATAADTLLEYSETQKEIACLRKRIEPFAEGFKALGTELSIRPEHIEAKQTDVGFRFAWQEAPHYGRRGASTAFEFDPAELVQLLQDAKAAVERINRLKRALQDMGHGHIVGDH